MFLKNTIIRHPILASFVLTSTLSLSECQPGHGTSAHRRKELTPLDGLLLFPLVLIKLAAASGSSGTWMKREYQGRSRPGEHRREMKRNQLFNRVHRTQKTEEEEPLCAHLGTGSSEDSLPRVSTDARVLKIKTVFLDGQPLFAAGIGPRHSDQSREKTALAALIVQRLEERDVCRIPNGRARNLPLRCGCQDVSV